jgi:Ca2+/Na+ antiporter
MEQILDTLVEVVVVQIILLVVIMVLVALVGVVTVDREQVQRQVQILLLVQQTLAVVLAELLLLHLELLLKPVVQDL